MSPGIFLSILGQEYRRRKEFLNSCPIKQARWCVISKQEMDKCENMIMAFAAKGRNEYLLKLHFLPYALLFCYCWSTPTFASIYWSIKGLLPQVLALCCRRYRADKGDTLNFII